VAALCHSHPGKREGWGKPDTRRPWAGTIDAIELTMGEARGIEAAELLRAHRSGEAGALDRLTELVYEDLRRLARHQRRRSGARTLNTTALVHEAYLKLAAGTSLGWEDRAHFLAVAGRAIRHILIDYARATRSAKRGAGAIRVELDEAHARVEQEVDRLLLLDELLDTLGERDSRLVRVVECRYFAGMTEPETAEALGISDRTVRRSWTAAREKLRQALTTEGAA
jgi:RNA polymerase sigma factor (TIGR02999 family)